MLHVLVADRDAATLAALKRALDLSGYQSTYVSTWQRASTLLRRADRDGESSRFDVLVCDVETAALTSSEIVRRSKAASPRTEIILTTGRPSVRDAIAAIRAQAADYLPKPIETQALLERLLALARVARVGKAREVTPGPVPSLPAPPAPAVSVTRVTPAPGPAAAAAVAGDDMVGDSAAMVRLRARIAAIADSDTAVLVTGESGTGKELVARAMHQSSRRASHPLVTVNAAALPQGLVEAELFGHERGAFTGADRRREGRFVAADGGTLFLDEIGDLPLEAQVKLLRVLQEGTFEPLGSNRTQRVDVRMVSATNHDLRALCRQGRFREDLYYRLRVFEVMVPPLRERISDLPLLVDHILRRFGRQGEAHPVVSPATWAALRRYPFPGNVREHENVIHHAVTLARGSLEIAPAHLPPEIQERRPLEDTPTPSLSQAVEQFERAYIQRALALAGGEKKKAAQILGISRQCLYQKLAVTGPGPGGDGPAMG
jgi:DNA-binding NtrC family response regulator